MTDSFVKRLVHGCVLLASLAATGACAEVVLHGSGTTLTGNIEISSGMGATHGGNLFHSFSVFNVQSGESVLFSGPTSIHNVISRVTGGTSSLINGPVTVGIPGANFYFINPNGVIFGENGSINATGSIYLSTADAIRLADGNSFYADPGKTSVLTAADPVAFGFLSASPASIVMNGPWLGAPYTDLPVPAGKTFALVGGDIDIRAGEYGGTGIVVPGATVSLVSVGSPGEVGIGGLSNGTVDLSAFSSLGQIRMSGASFIDVSGDASGSIFIRGGQLTLSPAGLIAGTYGDSDGGVIDIAMRGDMVAETDPDTGFTTQIIGGTYGGMGKGAAINLEVGGTLRISDGSFVLSESHGPAAAGDIHVRAGNIKIVGQGLGELTGVRADNYDSAVGPSVTVDVGNLQVLNGGIVGTENHGSGKGGDLSINAVTVVATGTGSETLSLSTQTKEGAGDGGNLSLHTHTLALSNGARVDASNSGSGAAGDINIVATEQISINGERSGIFSETNAPDAGHGGAVDITTPLLTMNGGFIDTATVGNGDAGAINVHVGDLRLTGGAQIRSFSGGYDLNHGGVLVVGSGAAGSVTVDATGSVTISSVGANALLPSGLLAETRGTGAGGNVTVTANTLTVSDGAKISSSSISTNPDAGVAGNVNIHLGDSLTLRGGTIATQAVMSDGGNITITAPRLIRLADSRITTSVGAGEGAGGNISIDPDFLVLQNSQIIANAYGGPGGNIHIVAGQLITDPSTVISASSALGIDGTVSITAPESDLSAELAVLPASFVDASRLMRPGCGAARAGLSSLVELGRGGLPAAPDGYLPSLALGGAVSTAVAGGSESPQSARAMPDFAASLKIASAASAECWR